MCLDEASPDNAQAALNHAHNGPDSSLFLQPAGPLAIVQTYSAVQAVPKGSTFEQYQQDRTSEAEIEMQIVAVCYELCP